MLTILACVSDALLKLRINKLLSERNDRFVITDKPVKRDDLVRYDVIVIHSTYRMTDLFGFIENAVLQKQATVFYITTNINSNPFRKFTEHTHLIFIDEHKLDIELPFALKMFEKYDSRIKQLTQENLQLNKQWNEQKAMNQCKRALMKQGMSEEQAHQHILKFAMDHHVDKTEACHRLLEINSE